MYFYECGNEKKPLMIFLHGGGVSGWMWNAQKEYFKELYHILIPDLPGHGKSADQPFISIENCADEIMGKIASLHRDKKIIAIGLSLGAQIAVEMISRQNCRIHSAIIQSALVIPMRFMKKFIKPLTTLSFPFIKNERFSKLQARQLYITADLFENYFEDSKKITMQNLFSIFDANMNYTIPSGYKNASCNILIMYGDRENNKIKKSGDMLAQLNTHASKYVAKGIGHGISLKDPDLFNMIIKKWLE